MKWSQRSMVVLATVFSEPGQFFPHNCLFPRFTVEVLSVGNPTRARILTTQVLDREDVSTYLLTIVGRDTTTTPVSSTVSVRISLSDVNDDAPTFAQPSWVFQLNENINSALVMNFNVCKKIDTGKPALVTTCIQRPPLFKVGPVIYNLNYETTSPLFLGPDVVA
jgi:hypothetical protein